jgi:hypothetical protein
METIETGILLAFGFMLAPVCIAIGLFVILCVLVCVLGLVDGIFNGPYDDPNDPWDRSNPYDPWRTKRDTWLKQIPSWRKDAWRKQDDAWNAR